MRAQLAAGGSAEQERLAQLQQQLEAAQAQEADARWGHVQDLVEHQHAGVQLHHLVTRSACVHNGPEEQLESVLATFMRE